MNRSLFVQTIRRARVRIIAVGVATFLWGVLGPVLYSSVLGQLSKIQNLPTAVTHFGSGDLTSLTGTITELYEHPFLLAIIATVAVGLGATSVAGARQRGTLEMWLARPVSRRSLVATTAAVLVVILAVDAALLLAGTMVGALLEGDSALLPLADVPLVWLNATLLYIAFALVALAASVSSDRPSPAMAVGVVWLLLNYLLEVLAPLWDVLRPYQSWSLVHHFQPGFIFNGGWSATDLGILLAAGIVPLAYALWRFPRRDLAAPD